MTCEHWNLLVKIGNENEAMRELLRDLRRQFSAKEVAFEEQPTAWYRDAIDALLNDGQDRAGHGSPSSFSGPSGAECATAQPHPAQFDGEPS